MGDEAPVQLQRDVVPLPVPARAMPELPAPEPPALIGDYVRQSAVRADRAEILNQFRSRGWVLASSYSTRYALRHPKSMTMTSLFLMMFVFFDFVRAGVTP